jgi:hypothetical protein
MINMSNFLFSNCCDWQVLHYIPYIYIRAHQTRQSGWLFRLGFNEIAQFLSKSKALSVFFSPIIILFLQYSRNLMFLKFDPYRVWCSIFYSKLVNCILFKIIVQHIRFVKGRGTCDFQKSPRFSLTSPLSQLREKSSRPVFTMCGEPWYIYIYIDV